MDQLVDLIDFPHLWNIGVLQWLGALVKYIPELSHLQEDVTLHYHTQCFKLPMELEKTDICPLASSRKNEAVISELKDTFVDSLEQLGQEEGDYKHHTWLAGSDSMSFNNMHVLKKHLQAHKDPFQRFQYMELVLELWHGMWTDLSHLLLNKNSSLPSFEKLEDATCKLFDSYSTTSVQYQAEDGSMLSSLLEQGQTSDNHSSKTSKQGKGKGKGKLRIPLKNSDQTLSETIVFMWDALFSREVAYTVAEGDVGHAWEAMKVTVFTFARSTHSKYMTYMLEMICLLEWETHKELCEAILKSLLINLSGKPGDWQPADIVQELLNQCLKPVIQQKDAQFGSYHICNIWSHNIMNIYQLKADMHADIGLLQQTGKHTKPYENLEVWILLKEYKDNGLHCHQPGRHYGIPRDVDDIDGGLFKWVKKTTQNSKLWEEGNYQSDEDLDENEKQVEEHEGHGDKDEESEGRGINGKGSDGKGSEGKGSEGGGSEGDTSEDKEDSAEGGSVTFDFEVYNNRLCEFDEDEDEGEESEGDS
ncbi:hypothetical protein BDN71DRAFT_1435018 [Pleurotus eryngii]|uniref:DUF6589 domain-containing protein n=1 Tax=Pleurotus eryngii TaxID=5323 RepID=A0A9P5ZNR2_PLEER|nr:hypothetical protein BDN71DRAFT_1435018 [Pleurotus eryngii]